MSEQFTLDKTILGQIVGANKRLGLATRELVLILVTVCMLLMTLVFVGMYANYSPPRPQPPMCVSRGCLNAASNAVKLMNKSIDPCDDFYEYACGNYRTHNPRMWWQSRSVIEDLYKTNVDRIVKIISKTPPWFSKNNQHRKLINLFQSCMDVHARETQAGTPLLNKVLSKTGGWDVLETWDADTWDVNQAVKTVQADFLVNALYTARLRPERGDSSSKMTIRLRVGWPSTLYPQEFTYSTADWAIRAQKLYKAYVKKVANYLVRDSKQVNISDSDKDARLDQFVSDVYNVSERMAKIHDTYWKRDRYQVSLDTLNSWTGNVLDWTDQLSYLYRPSSVSGYTRVTLDNKAAFQALANLIKSLVQQETGGKRMLHHYLIWHTVERFLQHLSQDYAHADRLLLESLDGFYKFPGQTDMCMMVTYILMRDAVGAVYVQEHLEEGSKTNVTNVTLSLKTAVKEELDKTPWMDGKTRTLARRKLDTFTYKIGHPDWMADSTKVDERYSGLSITLGNYFDNVINGINFLRERHAKRLGNGLNKKQEWWLEPYDVSIRVSRWWNDMIVPGGILQDPIWSQSAPRYVTFGSLGGQLGRYLYNIIDATNDRFFRQWSSKAQKGYKTLERCVKEQYKNTTGLRAWSVDNLIALNSGVRLALKGYQAWIGGGSEAAGAPESSMPGVGLSPKQTLFLSFAQAHCHNMNVWHKWMAQHGAGGGNYWYGYHRDRVVDTHVNMALGQLQEFSDAFNCPAHSHMNHRTKCSYF